MFEIPNKIALITGARRGMGEAHAKALAKQGATVVVTDISREECDKVVQEITEQGGKAVAYKLDVTSESEIKDVFAKVKQEHGGVDILVNNAGIFAPKPALDLTPEEWDTTLNINLRGQFLCAKEAARHMKEKKWGRIINVSSIASGGAGIGFEGAAHYAASKGGVIGMSETLAGEWADYGITVNVIAPGAIDTPMVRDPEKELDKGLLEEIIASVPLKRMGTPEEVAAMAVFLASEESSYVTGATFYVDGGWLAA